MVGLTIETAALIEIRRHRLRLIGADGVRQDTSDYIDPESVKAEILQARRLCTAHGWPVIDVTRRSIEETAATVLQLMEAWHARRGQAEAEAGGGRLREPRRSRPRAPELILATASTARRAVLAAAGLRFTAQAAAVDEAAIKESAQAEGIPVARCGDAAGRGQGAAHRPPRIRRRW